MLNIQKVKDPSKIVTDAHVAKLLRKQSIDPDYVEFWHDYAPRSLGKEHSPYAKFYRDLKSGKKIMVTSALPRVKPDGTKIQIGWKRQGNKYVTKPNLFSAVIEGTKITVTCLGDQFDGRKEGDKVDWQPQLYLNNIEQTSGNAVLLPIDPTNPDLRNTTLEWDYGICKRRIRAIQGRLREKWVFASNPNGEVRIKHNHSGNLKLNLGEYGVNDDEEIVPTDVFNQAEYPLEIGASPETFNPDAGTGGTSVDGEVKHEVPNSVWADIQGGAGTGSTDSGSNMAIAVEWYQTDWNAIRKVITLFDTSPLPNDATVIAAVESLYGLGYDNDLGIAAVLKIYRSTPFANNALQNDDFVDIGTTPYSNGIADGAFNAAGWNDFTLLDVDADDFGYISRVGITKLGCRESDYDAANIEPLNGFSDFDRAYYQVYAADNGSNEPKLVITYTEPSAAQPQSSMAAQMMAGGLI